MLNMAPSTLDIKIIGGGIAGLASALSICRRQQGHEVTVYESSSTLSELGAGIQMFPNATRFFRAWGIEDEVLKVANKPCAMRITRYANDAVIADIPYNPMSAWEYDGLPILQLARPDLQSILAKACHEQGGSSFKLVFNKSVRSVDPEAGTIFFEDDTSASADLVIGADGIRSRCRESMPVNAGFKPRASQEYWFRATVDREVMLQQDPDIAALMEPDKYSMAWAGPGVVVLGYPIFGATKYNLVIMTPRPANADDLGKWSTEGDINEVAKILEPFNDRLRKIWSLVTTCKRWTVGDIPRLPTYSSESGRCILIGDAAHAIIPHVGAGGAMAIEDAAALGTFIGSLRTQSDLPNYMAAWGILRQHRVENMRRYAQDGLNWLNTHDGPEQEQRDKFWAGLTNGMRQMIEKMGPEGFKNMPKAEQNPDGTDMQDPGWRRYLWAYDAEEEANVVVQQLAARH
jgi:salicylate hydroxylase